MSDIVKRLRDMPVSIPLAETTGGYIDIGDEAADEIERLREALREFVECALFDPTMEGPRFKGWNRSALDRALPKARAALDADRRAREGTTS